MSQALRFGTLAVGILEIICIVIWFCVIRSFDLVFTIPLSFYILFSIVLIVGAIEVCKLFLRNLITLC